MNPFGDSDDRTVYLYGGEKDGQFFTASKRGQWAGGRHPRVIWVVSGLGERDIALNYPDGKIPPARLDELSYVAYRFDRTDGTNYRYVRAIDRDRPTPVIDLPDEYLKPQSREQP